MLALVTEAVCKLARMAVVFEVTCGTSQSVSQSFSQSVSQCAQYKSKLPLHLPSYHMSESHIVQRGP